MVPQRQDDQLRHPARRHLGRDRARAAHAEPPHHPGRVRRRLGQLHVLRVQHRGRLHLRVRVGRRQDRRHLPEEDVIGGQLGGVAGGARGGATGARRAAGAQIRRSWPSP
ncbi:hypothetical protein FOCC_FOCC007758 [Frankliniella occidentalis]|nr:hypothetical protein FOCC_FOCC007758 [Frankliniella occidentalis]